MFLESQPSDVTRVRTNRARSGAIRRWSEERGEFMGEKGKTSGAGTKEGW